MMKETAEETIEEMKTEIAEELRGASGGVGAFGRLRPTRHLFSCTMPHPSPLPLTGAMGVRGDIVEGFPPSLTLGVRLWPDGEADARDQCEDGQGRIMKETNGEGYPKMKEEIMEEMK